jgi:hypothetical protein
MWLTMQTAKSNQHTMTWHFTHFPWSRHASNRSNVQTLEKYILKFVLGTSRCIL